MAQYRRDLSDKDYSLMQKFYQKHSESKKSGLFHKNKRERLLDIKEKDTEEIKNEADFWLDVRQSVTYGIVDLKLVSDIASIEQQKQMFKVSDKQFSLVDALHSILKTEIKHVEKNTPTKYESTYVYPDKDEMAWKSHLAYLLVRVGIKFFLDSHSVESQLHKRNLEDTLDVLRIEMYQHLENLSDDQKRSITHNSSYVLKDWWSKEK